MCFSSPLFVTWRIFIGQSIQPQERMIQTHKGTLPLPLQFLTQNPKSAIFLEVLGLLIIKAQ